MDGVARIASRSSASPCPASSDPRRARRALPRDQPGPDPAGLRESISPRSPCGAGSPLDAAGFRESVAGRRTHGHTTVSAGAHP